MSASIAPSIEYAWDGPGTLGAPADGQYMRWNNTTKRFEMAAIPAGVTTLDGLSDVAITTPATAQVLRYNGSGWVNAALAYSDLSGLPTLVTDHGALTGLGDDDHPGAAWLAGRAGGQTLNLGLNSGDAGTVNSTAHATKGALTLGASQVLVPMGTPAIPSIGAITDTDTGLRINSAGDVRIVANGNDVYQFTASANTSYYNLIISATKTFTVAGGTSTFNPASAAGVPVIIKLAASHSANALEINTSAGSGGDVLRVTSAGALTAAAAISTPTEVVITGASSTLRFSHASGGTLKLGGGGTLRVTDGSSNILGTFVHGAGGTLRNAGTTRIEWNATGIGFFGVTPVARAAALTQTYSTAGRTLNAYTPDDESAAYTGIDNLGVGTVYATVADLNALRVAYETLRASHDNLMGFVNSIVDDLQAYGLEQ